VLLLLEPLHQPLFFFLQLDFLAILRVLWVLRKMKTLTPEKAQVLVQFYHISKDLQAQYARISWGKEDHTVNLIYQVEVCNTFSFYSIFKLYLEASQT
jgi:hypothetical protein